MAATFVHEGDFNEKSRQHPALRMLEAMTTELSSTNKMNPKWYAPGASFEMVDGTQQTVQQVNALTEQYPELESITVTESDGGYELRGKGKLYGNFTDEGRLLRDQGKLSGNLPGRGKDQVEDKLGRKWDFVFPNDWVKHLAKDEQANNEHGLVIKKFEHN